MKHIKNLAIAAVVAVSLNSTVQAGEPAPFFDTTNLMSKGIKTVAGAAGMYGAFAMYEKDTAAHTKIVAFADAISPKAGDYTRTFMHYFHDDVTFSTRNKTLAFNYSRTVAKTVVGFFLFTNSFNALQSFIKDPLRLPATPWEIRGVTKSASKITALEAQNKLPLTQNFVQTQQMESATVPQTVPMQNIGDDVRQQNLELRGYISQILSNLNPVNSDQTEWIPTWTSGWGGIGWGAERTGGWQKNPQYNSKSSPWSYNLFPSCTTLINDLLRDSRFKVKERK